MKSFFLLFLAITTAAFGSDYSREFSQLTAERDRAAAEALEPVKRRYLAQLETLLRHATQDGDLETAVKIKKAMEENGGKTAEANAKDDIAGTWDVENKTTHKKFTLTLETNGTFKGDHAGTWEIKGKHLILNYTAKADVFDKYELPLRDGKLDGQNFANQIMGMTKHAGQ